MKIPIFIIALFVLISFKPKKNALEIKIIDKVIKNGCDVSYRIINNSSKDYLILMDTIYYKKNRGLGSFLIYKSNGKTIPLITEMYTCIPRFEVNLDKKPYYKWNKTKDTLLVEEKEVLGDLENTAKIIKIKSNSFVQFKIPFSLVAKYSITGLRVYFKTNKTKKYWLSLNYSADKEDASKLFSKKALDSLKQNKILLFNGALNSNKVPLKFN